MNTKVIGDISQLHLMAALARLGYTVLSPFGDNQRYDLVIESTDGFQKVQCKTGKVYGDTIRFRTSSSYAHRGRPAKSYIGEVDFFGVYCPDNGKCYLIPIDVCPSIQMVLRLTPAKNGQLAKTHTAEKFELRSPDNGPE